MAAKEMRDYISNITADYTGANFTVKPQAILIEDGEFNQVVHAGDDNSEEVITIATEPKFYATLGWNALSEADAGTIFDFYFDTGKGYGMARTFQWEHPSDGHTYVVRFADPLTREYIKGGLYTYTEIRLRILGY